MGQASAIEWTDATWNPVRGCTPVSPGCVNCYAAAVAARFNASGEAYEGLATRNPGQPAKWTGKLALVEDALYLPLTWQRPKWVFVNSMSDLFHEDLPDAFIRRVFGVMSMCGQHTFQVLTKRPARMAAFFADAEENNLSACQAEETVFRPEPDPTLTPAGKSRVRDLRAINGTYGPRVGDANHWPLPNVWLGVSVENQAAADERIPHLLRTPAAVRFLSCEPLLGPVDLSSWKGAGVAGFTRDATGSLSRIDWVIAGGESGPGSRPCHVEWVRSLVAQCKAASIACFVKQLGGNPTNSYPPQCRLDDIRVRLFDKKGGDPAEWPEDLRVREFPTPGGV